MISKTSKILTEEHKNILKVIENMENEVNILEKGKEINKKFFEKAIDFIRNYADKFHHAKEENILFKEFDKAAEEGCAHCNPTKQMLSEHDEGRKFVKGIEQGVKENNKNKVIENARGYCMLLKEHIYKEDNILYPMADEALNENTKKSMLQKFNKINTERKKNKEKYLAFVKSLR